MTVQVKNGPQLTWTNIIATLVFGTMLIGALWTVFQTQFANIDRRMEKTEREQNGFVMQKEHKEFKKRMEDSITIMQKQLERIETTRPTTDTLKQLGDSAVLQAGKLEGRVQSIEDYLRTVRPVAPIATQPGVPR